IANQRAGQQSRFAENLKSVADAEHMSAIACEFLQFLHDRAEPRNRARAKIIAIAESTRNQHRVSIAERVFLVPNESRGMAEHVFQNVHKVLVAIGAGKLENSK